MKPLFLVLAKLTGLLHLYWTLTGLTQVGVMFSTMGRLESTSLGGMLIPVVGLAIYLLLALGIAWMLLVRTDWLAGKLGIQDPTAIASPSPQSFFLVGVRLIGVYVSVFALPALVRALVTTQQIWAHLDRPHVASTLISPILSLLLGLLLTFKGGWVVARISRPDAASTSA
jgi:hypothetical protein